MRGSAVIDAGRAPDACPAIDLAAFAAEPPALRALLLHDVAREALGGEALVERRVVDAMLRLAERGDDAGRVSLGRGLEAVRARGLLRIQARAPRHVCAPVRVTGAELEAAGGEGVALAPCGLALRARLLAGAHLDREAALTGAAFVGLDRAPGLVMVRHPRRGERFEPYGLGHETTVARYLAGARAPAASRARAIVLEVDGVCAWVGYSGADGRTVGRVAQAYRVAHSSVRTLHVVREGT